jgi:glucose/arabinose dehydrogenase
MIRILLTALLLLVTTAGLHAQNRIGQGDVKDLYLENCAACHGEDLSGGSGDSLIDDEWKHGASNDEISAVIRKGVPETEMLPWEGTLDDPQIRSLVIFIREQKHLASEGSESNNMRAEDGVFSTDQHSFVLEDLGLGDDILWSIDFLPDGSMLVTQRDGVLWIFRDGERTAITGTPEVWQHGQGGLLEVSLHPDYEENGWIYLSYSENLGAEERAKDAGMTAVVRGKIRDRQWVEEQKLFTTDNSTHSSAGAHYGSRFVFDKGYLYFGIGDRGRMEQAQDLGRPNGKIHRIHDDGRVPEDNPFVGREGAMPSIWSYGHRNPQGLDMDPATGFLWETEHGPRGGDEVNLIEKGKNYGWPLITYGMNYNGTPITDQTHREGLEQPRHYWVPSIAVAGIDFYEGDAFPEWKGRLLVGGMASNELHLLTIEGGEVISDEVILRDQGRVRDVASGPDGHIYLLLTESSPRKGKIVRLSPAN